MSTTSGGASTPAGGDPSAPPNTPAEIKTVADPRALFQADVTPRTPARAVQEYIGRLRSGDPGALPAVLGLVILVVIFSQVSGRFFTTVNFANLPAQAAYIAVIALGLVFILILGEIDLAAGTTGGMCAGFAAQSLQAHGLHKGIPGLLYWAVLILMVAALAIGILNRLIFAPVMIAIGLIVVVTGLDDTNSGFAILFGVSIGFAVGTFIGLLVAKVGIPSFVVTLALFLAFQGIILFALANQPINITRYSLWNGLAQNNMSDLQGWAFLVVAVGAYFAVTFLKSVRRRAAGLSADTAVLVIARAVAIGVGGAIVVIFLNKNRGQNNTTIEGVPWALSVPIFLAIISTIVLSKTTWGRHLFATGGNEEAARRAGIKVDQIKISAFAVASGLAALGGFFLSSFTGGVQLDLGQGNTLLFSVAAAVIGGTSLFGGRGKPRDAIIGAFVIAIIPNGIGLKPSLPPQNTQVITGIVLLIAATADAVSRRRARSG